MNSCLSDDKPLWAMVRLLLNIGSRSYNFPKGVAGPCISMERAVKNHLSLKCHETGQLEDFMDEQFPSNDYVSRS